MNLGEVIQKHLRLKVDPGASVRPDAASAAVGLASVSVIQALWYAYACRAGAEFDGS